jgi:hypothetical protein
VVALVVCSDPRLLGHAMITLDTGWILMALTLIPYGITRPLKGQRLR